MTLSRELMTLISTRYSDKLLWIWPKLVLHIFQGNANLILSFFLIFSYFSHLFWAFCSRRRAECVDRQLQRFKFHAVAPQFYRTLAQVIVKVQSFQFVSHTARQLLSGPRDPESSSRFSMPMWKHVRRAGKY